MHPHMSMANEALYLQRMLDEGGIDHPTLRQLAVTLFTARAIERVEEEGPLKIHRLLDEAMNEYRQLACKSRTECIRTLHATFGMDPCVQMLGRLGHRFPGVEWPAQVEKLGAHPVIRWQGREVFTGLPHVVRDIYDVLTGAKTASEDVRRAVWGLLGNPAGTVGELALHRSDGSLVESGAITIGIEPESEPVATPVKGP